jgi:voltage-gated potassium channel
MLQATPVAYPHVRRPARRLRRTRAYLRLLYAGDVPAAHAFRYGLLLFDIGTIAFIVVSSFLPASPALTAVDVAIGLLVLADFSARLASSRNPWGEFRHLTTWADVIALASFLAPVILDGAGFLRIMRTLRLLKTYQLRERLREDSAVFRRNEEVILAAANLGVFVFVMTSIVYETQRWTNPAIRTYVDALYFTVTSLTTTGYGDVTLQGNQGRLISVAIMLFGVTLFLRLAQVLFRPTKVIHPCHACGLTRHDADAVHCKACGLVLNIPDEGAD